MKNDSFRHYNLADQVVGHIDRALNNIFCPQKAERPYPAENSVRDALDKSQKKKAAGLMRVNHAGEMAAQALYHGQSLIARDPSLKDKLHGASLEEADHLNWCRTRLEELGEKPSMFDPLWYTGSFMIGIAAGAVGDRWNLGFLAETEYQVVRHLEGHLEHLPKEDLRSRAVIEQMKTDELSHAHLAESLGAAKLPEAVKVVMQLSSKVMTRIAEKF